jgi:hypothetical protein
MARVIGEDAENLVQADVSSIDCTVWHVPTGTKTEPDVTVSSAVFNALQTDSRWTVDSTGYNFRFTVPAASFAKAGKTRVEFKFTPASGQAFHVVFDVQVRALYRS